MRINFDKFVKDQMTADPSNYKWGIFYFNPKDKRIIVPKRLKMMGWTLNFANIFAYVILILIVVFAVILGKI